MVNQDRIRYYFPEISEAQEKLFFRLGDLYHEQNARVNLISRKDFDNFYTHHVLHSLALAKCCSFPGGSRVIDIGTGGGFPGIPLAIMFPDVEFTLTDSIGKKIRAVEEVAEALQLKNVSPVNLRTEQTGSRFDYATARAVAPMAKLYEWMLNQWRTKPVLYLLKGGDLSEEMNELLGLYGRIKISQTSISDFFTEDFFETKKVIVLEG